MIFIDIYVLHQYSQAGPRQAGPIIIFIIINIIIIIVFIIIIIIGRLAPTPPADPLAVSATSSEKFCGALPP
jgi:hypothetical protein